MTDLPVPERTRHRLSERYHQLLRDAGELHDVKQADYGEDDDPFANVRASADFGVPGWIGAILRGNDKMKRLQKAARQRLSGKQVKLQNESMENSLLDLAVYSLIALVLYEEEQGLLPPPREEFVWNVDDPPIALRYCEAVLTVITRCRVRSHYDPVLITLSPDVVKPEYRESFIKHTHTAGQTTLWGIPLSFDVRLAADAIELRYISDGCAGNGFYVTEFSFDDLLAPES